VTDESADGDDADSADEGA